MFFQMRATSFMGYVDYTLGDQNGALYGKFKAEWSLFPILHFYDSNGQERLYIEQVTFCSPFFPKFAIYRNGASLCL